MTTQKADLGGTFTAIAEWFARALILWLCWNGIFPEWVNLPALTYWRAFALVGVAKALLPRRVAA